jgi:hypothetical protein
VETTKNEQNYQNNQQQQGLSLINNNKQTLLFIIGGITRTEMSILNQLPFKIFCCTTSFMNANDLINSFKL